MLGSLLPATILLYIWCRLADVTPVFQYAWTCPLVGGVKVEGVRVRPAGWTAAVPSVPRRRQEASTQKYRRMGIPRGCVEMVSIIARWTSYNGWDSDNTTWWVSTLDR